MPFATRTVTVLQREGVWADMTRLDDVEAADAVDWWYSGHQTIDDLTTTGNDAIAWHHNEGLELVAFADEEWTHQIWRRDRRFADLLPATYATVAEVCVAGSHLHQRQIWVALSALRPRMFVLGTERDDEALRRYVGAVTGKTGDRLVAIMRVNGLEDPPLLRVAAAAWLGVSGVRVTQLARKMRMWIDRATPPAGVWMPQEPARRRLEEMYVRQ